jgi:hypothetical protein
MPEDPKELQLAFSVPRFAAAHDVSESFIWNEIANGELESLLAGDRRLITPEQGARWRERKAELARQKRQEREAARLCREQPTRHRLTNTT